MTAKERAEFIVQEMQLNLFSDGHYDAKQCALVCVNEILSICTQSKFIDYWTEVKREIQLL